eukprot:scaffold96323_cov28-Prasinocladus_malaysianus.AAC.1
MTPTTAFICEIASVNSTFPILFAKSYHAFRRALYLRANNNNMQQQPPTSISTMAPYIKHDMFSGNVKDFRQFAMHFDAL